MEEGAIVPSREDRSDVPSLPDPQGPGQMGFQIPNPSALSTHTQRKPRWVETLATYRPHRALLLSVEGWDRVKGAWAWVLPSWQF